MGWEGAAKHLSKPLVKLIEVSSKGAGEVFSLCFAKRIVDNKKYEIEQIGSAIENNGTLLGEVKYTNGEVSLESLGSKTDSLEERSKLRKDYITLKEQSNIERIVAHSAINLSKEESVSNESVDEDWISRFFKYAEDITSKDMQEIWGKVLAGEIKQPNSYSIRTLETLRNLTKKDAEILIKAAKIRISCDDGSFIYKYSNNEDLGKYDFSFGEQLHLNELGILQSNPNTAYDLFYGTEEKVTPIIMGDYKIKVIKLENTLNYTFPIIQFTSVGHEILELINSTINEDYFENFCRRFSEKQFELKYAVILNKDYEGRHDLGPWLKFEV